MEIIKKFEPLFGEWHAEKFLGAGNYGRVYKAYKEEFGTRYYSAIKYISIPANDMELKSLEDDSLSSESITSYYDALAKDVASETRLMSQLKGYSNIVSYEDSKVIKKPNGVGYDIFIRMELLQSLAQKARTAPLTRDEVVALGMDICTALDVCNGRGIIHRDIKPDNIFQNEHGDYKLGDFGIARQLEKTESFMSKKGTYNYMAPEVYKGEKYGASCDICSLGLVMYRLLNRNRLPFLPPAPQDITPNDKETSLMRRLSGESIPMPCDADRDLAAIVLKACAYRPEDRFSSAAEMREALKNYKESHPASGAPVGAAVPPIDGSKARPNNAGDKTVGIYQSGIPANMNNAGARQAQPRPAFCTKCGAQLAPGDAFCTKCGNRMGAAPVPPVPTPTPVPGPTPQPRPTPPRPTPQPDNESGGKKGKTGLIIGIAAALVCVLGAAAVAGYFLLKNKDNDDDDDEREARRTHQATEGPEYTQAVPDYTETVVVPDYTQEADYTQAPENTQQGPTPSPYSPTTPEYTQSQLTPTPYAAPTAPNATQTPDPSTPVTFWNSAFESALRSKTGLSGTITYGDILGITKLDLSSCNLSDIRDIAMFANLRDLTMNSNSISDISPLAELKNLTKLEMRYNKIASLEPLRGLTNLESIILLNNYITDLSPLSGLTRLDHVGLGNNKIYDISPLRDLTITYLAIKGNFISDFSPLRSMTRLTYLSIYNEVSSGYNSNGSNNVLNDVTVLYGLTNLETLKFSRSQISEQQVQTLKSYLTRVKEWNPVN